MSYSQKCDYCHRPVRDDARHYRKGSLFFHFECTEPPPAMNVAQFTLKQGDTVAVLFQHHLNMAQREQVMQAIGDCLGTRVIVLDGGAGLALLTDRDLQALDLTINHRSNPNV
jgi:hypothetical protein